ncbi:MAG: hypothetical protein LBG88_03865 [Christensenellaceae bacterium]|jgi:hypothetical protein|nr:hypothetical protein [Christensenellaceae bacterium]
MKLKSLITDAAKMMGICASETSKNFSILFRCANLAVSCVACNYLECVAIQTFAVTDGKIDFTQFEKKCLKIKSVKVGGREIQYDLFMNRLTVPNGKVTVEYAYVPYFTDAEQEIATVAGRVDESVLLYGIMAEYAGISGFESEAKTYGDKFENLLLRSTRTGHVRVLPCVQ